MKSNLNESFRRYWPLIVAIIIAAVVTVTVSVPYWSAYAAARKSAEQWNAKFTQNAAELKKVEALPKIDYLIEPRGDVVRALGHVLSINGYEMVILGDNSDLGGRYFMFSFEIKNESMADAIVFLEKLRTLLPIAFTQYDFADRMVKVYGRCYHK